MSNIPQDKMANLAIYSMIKASISGCQCDVCQKWRKIAEELLSKMEV